MESTVHKSILIACITLMTALSVPTTFAVATVRTDIDASSFSSSWDVSGRAGYNVDVRCASFETLETFPISAVAKTFDIDTTSHGFVLRIR